MMNAYDSKIPVPIKEHILMEFQKHLKDVFTLNDKGALEKEFTILLDYKLSRINNIATASKLLLLFIDLHLEQ